MQTLNLINPDKSEVKYKIFSFPDGEPHIVFEEGSINRKEEILIICRITNLIDLFILMQIGDILNTQKVLFHLDIVYLMSMRMDRIISFNEAYSLKIVIDIINNMSPQSVSVVEPHSKKTKQLLHNYRENVLDSIAKTVIYNTERIFSKKVFPDKGALQRYQGNENVDVICSKIRDLSTGKLSGFKIENPEIIKDLEKPLIVIDDLCDGGGTFVGIAEELKKYTSIKPYIYVTHMVNPLGIIALSEHYDRVYFTNSFKDWEKETLPSNVKVVKIV